MYIHLVKAVDKHRNGMTHMTMSVIFEILAERQEEEVFNVAELRSLWLSIMAPGLQIWMQSCWESCPQMIPDLRHNESSLHFHLRNLSEFEHSNFAYQKGPPVGIGHKLTRREPVRCGTWSHGRDSPRSAQ